MKKMWAPVLVFIAAMLWATDGPFRAKVAADLPSFFIVLVEHFFSLLILSPFLIKTFPKLKNLSPKGWLSLIIIGVGSSALALIFFTESFKLLNPSAAIILQKLQPLFAIFLAYTILKERPHKHFWIFAIVGMIGAYLISFPTLTPQVFEGETWNLHFLGVLFAVGAALLWAAGTVFGRIALSEFSWKETTSLRFFVAFIFLALWNLKDGAFSLIPTLSAATWGYLFLMSMVSGALGLLLYYRGLRDTKASVATIAELGFVAAALLVNYIFLDAILLPMQNLGMLILLFSVLMLAKRQDVVEKTD
ncbi:MAG TPA: DMT family transporter [Candidatus Paceibacterota bacterium]|nr:DMT family transporter [Candidatus Paceibacterota bacterium]